MALCWSQARTRPLRPRPDSERAGQSSLSLPAAMKVLLEVEAQTLAEGREWTRQRLEERLQAQADQIEAVCPQSGLALKYVRLREVLLMTCVGSVTVRDAYGISSVMQWWLSPA